MIVLDASVGLEILHGSPNGVAAARRLLLWELRENVTVYDASYVALVEALGATLLTRDARPAGAAGVRANVELV